MRISVTNSDPGYFAGSYRCTAYLDGVKLDNCVTADEDEGLALCYDMSGEVRLIELRGEVEINTRDENGVCILCGVSGAEMHHDDCPRAKEWNHINLAGPNALRRVAAAMTTVTPETILRRRLWGLRWKLVRARLRLIGLGIQGAALRTARWVLGD